MPKVTMFPNIRETKNGRECNLELIYNAIKAGKWKDEVNDVRIGKTDKKVLPYFTASGTFTERKESGLTEHSNRLVIDIDNLDDVTETKAELAADKYTEFCSVSASGKGLFLVVKIDGQKHKESFRFLERYYRDFYGVTIDPACKDVSRARFVSYDPDAWTNNEAQTLTIKAADILARHETNFTSKADEVRHFIGQLGSVDITQTYPDWRNVGFALADEFGELGREMFHDVSGHYPGYNQKETDRQFTACLSSDGSGITLKTFFHAIKQAGLEIGIKKATEKPIKELPKDEFALLCQSLEITQDDEYDEPKPVLSYKDVRFATQGNIVTVTGKAKSRKSTLLSFMVAAYLKNGVVEGFHGHRVAGKSRVVVFDTEQDGYYIQKAAKRALKLGGTTEENLTTFKLRGLPFDKRKEFIESYLEKFQDVGLVVIDGIKDIVGDINDQIEATKVTDYFLRLADSFNFCLVNVLHMNKGDFNLRGALGTESQNKSETVLSVTKCAEDPNISIVKAEYSRYKDIEEFAFSVDETGTPYIVEDYSPGQPVDKFEPETVADSVHNTIIDTAFTALAYDNPTFNQFTNGLKSAFRQLKYNVSGTKAKEFAEYYRDIGRQIVLTKEGSYYVVSKTASKTPDIIPDNDFSPPDDLPF